MGDDKARTGSQPPMPATALPPVVAYAERFPTLPLVTVVECLLDTWHEVSSGNVDDDRTTSFDRLATERLSNLVARGRTRSSGRRG